MRKLFLVALATCLLLQPSLASAKSGQVFTAPYSGATISAKGDADPEVGTLSAWSTADGGLGNHQTDTGEQYLFQTFDYRGPTREVTVTLDMTIVSASATTGSAMGDDGHASGRINVYMQKGTADQIGGGCCTGQYVMSDWDYPRLVDTFPTTPEPSSIEGKGVLYQVVFGELSRGTYTIRVGVIGHTSYSYTLGDTETGAGAPGESHVELDAVLNSITLSS